MGTCHYTRMRYLEIFYCFFIDKYCLEWENGWLSTVFRYDTLGKTPTLHTNQYGVKYPWRARLTTLCLSTWWLHTCKQGLTTPLNHPH